MSLVWHCCFTVDFGFEESVVADDVDVGADLELASSDATRDDRAAEIVSQLC